MAIVFNKAKANYVVPEDPRGSRAGGKSRNAMNRVPSVGRLESKDGTDLDYFDDGKGSVSSTSYGGYKTAISSRVEDMDRVEDAINPMSMTSQKANSATFRGMVRMGGVGLNAINLGASGQSALKYVSNDGTNPDVPATLYLDGSLGGEIGTFIRTEAALTIDKIIVDQTGDFGSSIVVLESSSSPKLWTLDCDTGGGGNDEINTDSGDILDINKDGNGRFTIPAGGRALLTQSAFDWKVQSLTNYTGLIPPPFSDAPASSTTWAMSHRVKVTISGTEYYLALDAV